MALGRLTGGIVARETLLALLVLALAFLNFGHLSISAASEPKFTADSWCGDPSPDTSDHSPCHACRIGGGTDLPPQPASIEPVIFATASIIYVDTKSAFDTAPLLLVTNPRAPPFV